MKQVFKNILTPLTWTIFIQVLFCLPGSSLPSPGMFAIPNLDKIVHILLLGSFVWLWCYYFSVQGRTSNQLKIIYFVLFCIAAANGILIEYIQYYFIPNRAFDKGDIIADLIGSSLAYGCANLFLLKEKEPTIKR